MNLLSRTPGAYMIIQGAPSPIVSKERDGRSTVAIAIGQRVLVWMSFRYNDILVREP
jgi:hypothetical protein